MPAAQQLGLQLQLRSLRCAVSEPSAPLRAAACSTLPGAMRARGRLPVPVLLRVAVAAQLLSTAAVAAAAAAADVVLSNTAVPRDTRGLPVLTGETSARPGTASRAFGGAGIARGEGGQPCRKPPLRPPKAWRRPARPGVAHLALSNKLALWARLLPVSFDQIMPQTVSFGDSCLCQGCRQCKPCCGTARLAQLTWGARAGRGGERHVLRVREQLGRLPRRGLLHKAGLGPPTKRCFEQLL